MPTITTILPLSDFAVGCLLTTDSLNQFSVKMLNIWNQKARGRILCIVVQILQGLFKMAYLHKYKIRSVTHFSPEDLLC